MKLKILSSAVEDLKSGRRFYGRQGDRVGEYFLDSLFSDIDSLVLYAGIHPKVFGYHRLLSRRFPHAVYYTLDEDLIVVWRVLDLRRDPDKIRDILK
uniref:ParE toxin of type II toxin-antitoxin system, parDE n=1 Tax=Candidatus Kentrum eta TaxID=2126337 RepID=A0A450UB08_9GAMM|nr:MAG: ParE toxin of type II toxin-antitoxin system, parDE [Candidatus Kentron sp. H]VFJ91126.1 MAG: ParE toxin of type II toxin-antitoxin system, parDE [Candidatus Kentron sp. H]VFJ97442.1 MAG: ParE toxin of type II toxin-antitoxin system, parDE [Candidatus Kentron sp. H]